MRTAPRGRRSPLPDRVPVGSERALDHETAAVGRVGQKRDRGVARGEDTPRLVGVTVADRLGERVDRSTEPIGMPQPRHRTRLADGVVVARRGDATVVTGSAVAGVVAVVWVVDEVASSPVVMASSPATRSARTAPASTEASWSGSPTMMSRVVGRRGLEQPGHQRQ